MLSNVVWTANDLIYGDCALVAGERDALRSEVTDEGRGWGWKDGCGPVGGGEDVHHSAEHSVTQLCNGGQISGRHYQEKQAFINLFPEYLHHRHLPDLQDELRRTVEMIEMVPFGSAIPKALWDYCIHSVPVGLFSIPEVFAGKVDRSNECSSKIKSLTILE
ncbi:hypothetical protein LOAG_10657 [Loa loa]|uniref:Uncharacterized protein n=1 Tax=Loa loa TaxID=7209 RepID=A0A1S0TQ13_LOALO|nr:hypothetical protein LOAG_10657 [Loa loa]EFO17839.2 hypothetical protein LOAG_10657 [Loa loa]